MAPRLSTLDEIDAALWRELTGCVRDKRHPWRTPVLATVDGEGASARAEARTVVLREVGADAKELLLYTDIRAGKLGQLRAHPHGTLVMWSPELGWQLRCRVQLSAENEGLAVSSRWATIRHSPAEQDYLSALPPGSPLDTPAAAAVQRQHFAVVTARVLEIDWLELHAEGHRRASFSARARRWLQP
jgi:pyridoxamine 5'-phosphate oxidase